MAPPQTEAFQTAVVDSKKLTSKPDNDELLDLYGTQAMSSPDRGAQSLRALISP